jgi:hypothetical protein
MGESRRTYKELGELFILKLKLGAEPFHLLGIQGGGALTLSQHDMSGLPTLS